MANSTSVGNVPLVLLVHSVLQGLLLAPIVLRIKFLLLAPVRARPAQMDKVPPL